MGFYPRRVFSGVKFTLISYIDRKGKKTELTLFLRLYGKIWWPSHTRRMFLHDEVFSQRFLCIIIFNKWMLTLKRRNILHVHVKARRSRPAQYSLKIKKHHSYKANHLIIPSQHDHVPWWHHHRPRQHHHILRRHHHIPWRHHQVVTDRSGEKRTWLNRRLLENILGLND